MEDVLMPNRENYVEQVEVAGPLFFNDVRDRCAKHDDFFEALYKSINNLTKEVVGLRGDNKWWFRIGGCLLTLIGIAVTVSVPLIVSSNREIEGLKLKILLAEKNIQILQDTDNRIIRQRNFDHSKTAPIQ